MVFAQIRVGLAAVRVTAIGVALVAVAPTNFATSYDATVGVAPPSPGSDDASPPAAPTVFDVTREIALAILPHAVTVASTIGADRRAAHAVRAVRRFARVERTLAKASPTVVDVAGQRLFAAITAVVVAVEKTLRALDAAGAIEARNVAVDGRAISVAGAAVRRIGEEVRLAAVVGAAVAVGEIPTAVVRTPCTSFAEIGIDDELGRQAHHRKRHRAPEECDSKPGRIHALGHPGSSGSPLPSRFGIGFACGSVVRRGSLEASGFRFDVLRGTT
jgi:hypothetical protein